MIQMQSFLGNGDQHVGGYSDPDLSLHRVLAGAKEHLDAQMLLDPLEEQLHLPALAVQTGNQLRPQGKVVGQKHQPLSGIVFDNYPAQRGRVVLARIEHAQHPGLVAQHIRVDPVHRVRVTPLELGVALGTRHKERFGFVNNVQPGKVQVTPVQQVKRSWLEFQFVQRIDLVRLAIGDVNEAGDISPQVQQRMKLDGGLGGAKRCPGKHRQTQIDGGGIERVDRPVQIEGEGLAGIQRTRHANQVLRKVGVYLPRARGVCIGQRVARDRLAAKPHVEQPPGLCTQVDFDIAQRLPVGQLRKGHGEELIQTREVFDLVLASVIGHAATKRGQRQEKHELREYELALVHRGFGRKSAKNPKSDFRRSNRDQIQTLNSPSKSLTYDVLMCKRWDTTEVSKWVPSAAAYLPEPHCCGNSNDAYRLIKSAEAARKSVMST